MTDMTDETTGAAQCGICGEWRDDPADERELAERVERGAALLDERRPGWWDEVDVGRLSIRDCDLCVLAQLWGWYLDGRDELFGGVDQEDDYYNARRHGFDDAPFKALTDLWRAAIEHRRAADRTTP
jgi:hypothetical protein